MGFPVPVANSRTQPSTIHYTWALRLAFLEWGLPKTIQVDKDSVFIENNSRSPFPSLLHLWLIGHEVDLCFIKQPPPYKNATVERSHQTMVRQVLGSKAYPTWKQLFQTCNKQRKRINERLPNRMLGNKPPLVVFPEAANNPRRFDLEYAFEHFDMERIYAYLAQGTWFRRVSRPRMISLGGQRYYLKKASPYAQLQITFCPETKRLIFTDGNDTLIAKAPLKRFDKIDILGATKKELLSMKHKLFFRKQFPIET
jgi:hypothetical protein